MLEVRVDIVRFVDPWQPGFVECKLVDAYGDEWRFLEKVPIVTAEQLDETSVYPQPGFIGCQILGVEQDAEGREIITIDTEHPWGVAATNGETQFDVQRSQLVEIAVPKRDTI